MNTPLHTVQLVNHSPQKCSMVSGLFYKITLSIVLCIGFTHGLTHTSFCAAQGLMAQPTETIKVGSKRFTESYILGEILQLTLQDAGIPAIHRQGLGNTAIVVQALSAGHIDVYPEYTGTILREILKRPETQASIEELNQWLAPQGLKAAIPLGFNNTYALAMKKPRALALGLQKISDIKNLSSTEQASLRLALSPEFTTRADGWPALVKKYALTIPAGKVLDHGLAYAALARNELDIIDAYSTDAAIQRLDLVLLEDDLHIFPRYDAVLLMRLSVDETLFKNLTAKFSGQVIANLNGQAESGIAFTTVARSALDVITPVPKDQSLLPRFFELLLRPDLLTALKEHLLLVLISSTLALCIGLPLGVFAHRRPQYAAFILGFAGILQTIPSLALLAILIALLGQIGSLPAVVALFLYGLLPIVNATHTGLLEIPKGLKDAGLALGFSKFQVLRWVELPLARPMIMAGLSSATVIGVGTCTLAALVGAGGLGERIVAGLAVNDPALMLAGALPAGILAIVMQVLLTPKQLKTFPKAH